MSTRANIVILDKDNMVHLYSHHDGYIDGGIGDMLTEFIWNLVPDNNWKDANDLAKRLVEGHHPEPNSFKIRYTADIHGDIQFLYIITIETGQLPLLKCYEKKSDLAWEHGIRGINQYWTKHVLVNNDTNE